MGLRWVIGGSYAVQAAPELTPRADILPEIVNQAALLDGSETDPVFVVPSFDPETHQAPVEIRLYAIPPGEILPIPGASGADVVASPHAFSSVEVPANAPGAELRLSPPSIGVDRFIALVVYGFAS